MTKRIIMLLAVLVCIGGAVTASAQVRPDDTYIVQPGDNLSHLAWLHKNDQARWREIVADNPFLDEARRSFERDGKHIVLIYPGETLYGVKKHGIMVPRAADLDANQPIEASSGAFVPAASDGYLLPWWLIAIAAAVALALILVMSRRARRRGMDTGIERERRRIENARVLELNQDPATSGPAIIEGGVPPTRAEEVARRMTEVAESHQLRLTPGMTHRPVPVGDLVHGRITSREPVAIAYRDGTRPRYLNNERGYRQTFRFTLPTGNTEEQETYFLERCGNDVIRHGGLDPETIDFFPDEGAVVVSAQRVAADLAASAPGARSIMASVIVGGYRISGPCDIEVLAARTFRIHTEQGPVTLKFEKEKASITVADGREVTLAIPGGMLTFDTPQGPVTVRLAPKALAAAAAPSEAASAPAP